MLDEDRQSFIDQARREGISLSAWLRAAAHERLQARRNTRLFKSPEDVEEFFRSCADLDGPETEPDWSEHLRVMNRSREQGYCRRVIFVDTNVFMYAVGRPHSLQTPAQHFFVEANRSGARLCTSFKPTPVKPSRLCLKRTFSPGKSNRDSAID